MAHVFRNASRFLAVFAVLACFVLAGTLCASAPAFADEKEPATVRVGYYENEVFQEGAHEGAVKTGYAYEYYRKISEYTGWRYEYVYGDFGDLYQQLIDGDIDLLAGLAWQESRADIIGYPESAMGNETYNLVKHDTDTTVTVDPKSMKGSTIGVLDSAVLNVLESYLETHKVEAKVKAYSNYTSLFKAFDNHDIDIVAVEGTGAYGRDHAEVLGTFGHSDYYLCVNKKRSDLLVALDTAQAQLNVDEPGFVSSLSTKYYSESMSSRAFSAHEREWMDTHNTLRVAYLNNYLPYSDTDENGNATGIVRDLPPRMLTSMGITNITVTYQGFDSYDEMVAAMSSGDVDVAFPVGGGLYYSEENGIYQSNSVVSSATELIFKGPLTEDKTKSFAVNENNQMQYYYVTTEFPDAEISFYPSIDACLHAVADGEAGCTTLNGLRANDILRNREYSELSMRQLTRNDERCFGVKIGNEGLLKLINRGLNVVGDDYAQNQAYRYTEGLSTYTLWDAILDNMALVGTAALALAALVIVYLIRRASRSRQEVAEKERSRKALEEKNIELAESQRALSDALDAAEHANRAKTVFLNNMSHDIRTPMNAIIGFTALAASHIDNKEQVQDYLGKISTSSQHLLSLINDVLDMSRIESGKVKIEETDVHLPDLIHDIRNIIQASITSKQLELFIDTQDVVNEDIVTDRLRLNQVLLNILSNAIKFTPADGTVSLRVIEHPGATPGFADFEFRVKDTGIGMSEEFQKTIFDAFTREQSSTVSGIQGTGLGMAITKNIVDMMGGTITVNSAEGKGSEFIVGLRFKISGNAPSYGPVPELQGVRALVADDDTNTCLSVCAMLREVGMRPDWTSYGKEAVVRAKDAVDHADPFGAYIIDWMMPDLNGIEVVRRIRKIIGDAAPIIILTAYDWSDIEEEAREAGVTAFCSKPLFMSELRNVLTRPFREKGNEIVEEADFDFSGKRVLLAEDNELNQQIAQAILEGAGFEVDIAADGTIAVEKMEREPAGYYDVVLMDIQMPQMDGYEASRRIRALDDPAKANLPIIAVTANAFVEDRKDALEAGMDGHLPKPYEVPVMMETLARFLK
ncbi:MAG: response regulator [Coriobacteriia bacterium]|nr:response regulator [Coriobacteriia bacterium]